MDPLFCLLPRTDPSIVDCYVLFDQGVAGKLELLFAYRHIHTVRKLIIDIFFLVCHNALNNFKFPVRD